MSLPHGGRFPWNISWRFVKMGRSTTLHSNIHRCSKARGREALQCALGLNAKTLHVFSDSEVIAKQNEGRVPLPQPEALLPELDLPEIGPVARFLDLTRPAREQHRGEQSGQFSCPQRGMMAQPSFSHHLGMSVR